MLFNNNYHNSQLQKPPHLQINGRKIYSYLLTHMTGVAILWVTMTPDRRVIKKTRMMEDLLVYVLAQKRIHIVVMNGFIHGRRWMNVLDGEVGKRLNQMIPIPHVPRTNGEIPSVDEATLGHQRLLDRLQMYELVESKVEGDGNCQFRALSDQIYRTSEHHKFVREQIVNQLKSYPEKYEGYVPMAYGDYIEKMSKYLSAHPCLFLSVSFLDYLLRTLIIFLMGPGMVNGEIMLLCRVQPILIFVITSFKDTCCIEILPNFERSKRVICLSFWAEAHYNSIYPEGGWSAC